MNKLTSRALPRAPGWLRAALLLVLLGGCGGGVDSGGTGGATVYASGPINGYGSVVVNGVHFDDSTQNISDDDGAVRSRSDLKLGMIVELRGSSITTDSFGDSNSVASSIVLGSEIVGPIDAGSIIDTPTEKHFQVLGRRIDVQPTSVFSDDLFGGLATLATLALPQYVEVYGLYNAVLDRFTATRIERKTSQPVNYRIGGRVANLVTANKTFSIGTAQVQYTQVQPSNLPLNFGEGAIVRVRLDNTSGGSGVWAANRLRSGVNSPADGQESKIEGVIDSVGANTFSVAGVSVTTNPNQTVFDPPGAQPSVGLRVEVEGRFAGGSLAATSVEVELDGGDDFDFRGALQAVSTNTLTINNVSISYTVGSLQIDNGRLADLTPNRIVRVRARLVQGTQLVAYRIQIRN